MPTPPARPRTTRSTKVPTTSRTWRRRSAAPLQLRDRDAHPRWDRHQRQHDRRGKRKRDTDQMATGPQEGRQQQTGTPTHHHLRGQLLPGPTGDAQTGPERAHRGLECETVGPTQRTRRRPSDSSILPGVASRLPTGYGSGHRSSQRVQTGGRAPQPEEDAEDPDAGTGSRRGYTAITVRRPGDRAVEGVRVVGPAPPSRSARSHTVHRRRAARPGLAGAERRQIAPG